MEKQRKKWGELPADIILEILSRLPVKAILRFKCVCKLWKSLLSNPNFILSTTRREQALVFLKTHCRANPTKPFGFYSVDDDLSVVKLPNPTGEVPSSFNRIEFLGTCNGLIMFCAHPNRHMYLWNPSTKCCRELSQLRGCREFPQLKGVRSRLRDGILGSGLCFDKSSNDYKVVLVNTPRVRINHTITLGKSGCVVASLSQGENGKDISFPYKMPNHYRETSTLGVLASGHLHWIANEEIGWGQLIVYFDEEMNQFRELPMPDGGVALYFGLTVLNGCLCMSRVARPNYEGDARFIEIDDRDNDVFIMREYGVKHSWTKLCTIRGLFVPLHTRIPSNLVLVLSGLQMRTYNLEKKYFRRIKVQPASGKDPSVKRARNLKNKADGNLEPVHVLIHDRGPLMYVESFASVDLI